MSEKNIQSEDYISFSSLKQFFIRLLRLFFSGLEMIGDICRKSWLLLLTGIVIGGLAGWLYHTVTGRKYKVSMLVAYHALDKKTYMTIVDQLGLLVRTGSGDRLAAQLGISPLLAGNLTYLGTENLLGVPLDKDTTTSNHSFRIVATFGSSYGVDSMGAAVIGYINGLPYVKQEIELRNNIAQDQLAYIQTEMARIDSLKKDYSRSLVAVKPGPGFYNNVFDPASIYKQSYTLDSLKTEVDKFLIHRDRALSIVVPFTAARTPQSMSQTMSIAAWMVIGFLVGFIFAALHEIKKKINVS